MSENTYVIRHPSAYMHLSPDAKSEVSDELLYGTVLRKICMRSQNGFLRCETSYGYGGFIHERYLSDYNASEEEKTYIVTSAECDLLCEPVYKYRPVMTLSRGSLLRSEAVYDCSSRFFKVRHGTNDCYVRTGAVAPYSPLYSVKKGDNARLRQKICDAALSYTGIQYRWAGKSAFGIDCSGLCFMAYFLCGIPLWRDAFADRRYVYEIEKEELKAADLIYFKGHAALYIGGGEFVHASASRGKVEVASLDSDSIVYREDLADKVVCFARSNLL